MPAQFNMLKYIKKLIELFAPYCRDRSTLDELYRMIDDRKAWHGAHDLFSRIRKKTNNAYGHVDELSSCQYSFEESCAKAIYNLTDTRVPFDSDAPFWVVPRALIFAKRHGIEAEVTRIVTEIMVVLDANKRN